ncbi:hypothetical protein APHAL10511_005675 [Amanita phalloides]|nr:hypothetical protein APHAL10511_005675 [Amanita phalloides]
MVSLSSPSPASPTFRAELAKLVSPLKRIRPRVPFWQLAAHRIPTLSLYRRLLRNASSEDIRFRVGMLFRQNRHLTGTERTIQFLNMGYKWLELFERAKRGDEHCQRVLKRYSSLIAVKREKAYWMYLGHKEMAWQLKLRSRPILTGFFRASLSNPPYPRLKPQPLAMSMIIKKRRVAMMKRHKRMLELRAMQQTIQNEQAFEKGLMSENANVETEPLYENAFAWLKPVRSAMADITEANGRARQRSQIPVPLWLKEAVRNARRERVANKTRQLERERRGEVLPRTIKRRLTGPPAHILAKMTAKQRKMDKVARSVSEVGYVAMVKRKLGFKLRDPDAWRVEAGCTSGEVGERLRKMAEEVRVENERRRGADNERQP